MSDASDNDFVLDPNVFRTFKLALTFKNLVSSTDADPTLLQLIEFSQEDKTLSLEVPARACASGHSVLVTIHEVGLAAEPELILSATAKVQSLEKLDDHASKAVLLMVQFEEEDLKKLIGLFAARQESISNFIAQSKD